jgi:hypothetical protein
MKRKKEKKKKAAAAAFWHIVGAESFAPAKTVARIAHLTLPVRGSVMRLLVRLALVVCAALFQTAQASWWWPEGPHYFDSPHVKEFPTPADFDRAMQDDTPLLVQFFAPCKCFHWDRVFIIGGSFSECVDACDFRVMFGLSGFYGVPNRVWPLHGLPPHIQENRTRAAPASMSPV